MYPHLAYVFIDGGYLRERAREGPGYLINPLSLANLLIHSTPIQTWAYKRNEGENAFLGRVTYYDGREPGVWREHAEAFLRKRLEA